ncbi:copper chaperone PCu(A)C [Mycobacterium doricum]|nr:copper chaperone PCu(A)C [Mycolicibacterium doricum]ORV44505.1 hypothetical protein AWC01_03300 [Mycolicibacterium doricum]
MWHNRITFKTAAAIGACVFALAGCTSRDSDESSEPMARDVAMTNQWASAADSGMTALFGSFTNSGRHDVRIVSGTSPIAGHVEVHEVVPDTAGGKAMQRKEGGLVVPAGGSRELIPGGDHLMLMDLKQPLQPGADVAVTVVFEDGSTLPVTAQVRDFAGGNENYSPGGGGNGTSHHRG